jgi:hypothetical protein
MKRRQPKSGRHLRVRRAAIVKLRRTGLRRPPRLRAVAAGAPEIWVVGNHYVTAVLADKPAWPLHHQSELITQNAVWTVHHVFSHRVSPLNILRAFK